MNPGDAYKQAGVDYGSIDPVKILAQKAAAATAGSSEVGASRGESAYVWEEANAYRALVIEGLGTKNLVADTMRKITGKTYYEQIAQDCVAAIVNDLITVGALPQVINAYWGIGDSQWLADKERAKDLVNGWAKACSLAGATWGGGETPTLKDIIASETIDLAGSAVGSINPKSNLVLGDKLAGGDQIILVESSGIHANGLTLARSVAAKLPDGLATKLKDGRMFGEVLLTPSHIYVPLLKHLQMDKVDIHYMVNITGHGWRKLMRAVTDFKYIIETVPVPPTEFDFIQKQSGASDEQMYGTFNMGVGFAVIVPADSADAVVSIAKACGLKAWPAGHLESGEKQVVIQPKNLTFDGKSLGVR